MARRLWSDGARRLWVEWARMLWVCRARAGRFPPCSVAP